MAANGTIPTSALTKLSTPGYLVSAAADSFERLIRDANTTGTEASAEAYRDLANQERLFFENYQKTYVEYAPGKVDRRVYEGVAYYRKPGHPSTAIPGTSNHGWGSTVDFQNLGGYDSSTWKEFAAKAGPHGWNNIEGKAVNEPWHWTYVEANDQHKDEESGVELNERVELTDAMKTMAGWTADSLPVSAILGYLASSSWASGGLDKKLATKVDTIIKNQEAMIAAIKAIAIKVDVDIPELTITMNGTVKEKPTP